MQKTRSLCSSSVLFVLLTTCAAADDAAEIKKIIPAASAMSVKDFKALAMSDTSPKASDFKDKTLTLMLFAMDIKADEDKKAAKQFRFLSENRIPKPAELAEEAYRVVRLGKLSFVRAPVTMIHADRITNCTCDVDGDKATGTVSFKVPKLYQGEADYVAKRVGDKWQIVEFAMPGREIHITRGDDGTWEKK